MDAIPVQQQQSTPWDQRAKQVYHRNYLVLVGLIIWKKVAITSTAPRSKTISAGQKQTIIQPHHPYEHTFVAAFVRLCGGRATLRALSSQREEHSRLLTRVDALILRPYGFTLCRGWLSEGWVAGTVPESCYVRVAPILIRWIARSSAKFS